MVSYAIVVIGYNRVESIKRLLDSLNKAFYDSDLVPLIISIDYSGVDGVEEFAKKFYWKHGEKFVYARPERLGLRRHILACGEFLNQYEAIAVFEDDIVAAPGFYLYMKQTVEFYKDDMRIAGISLYTHLWNGDASMPFQPAYSKHDVFFLQFAQSWGQIWLKKQWLLFREWYENNQEEFNNQAGIPKNVSNWSKNSWLKYHIKYCILENKYFVYPYGAFSTCFTDVGEHSKLHTNMCQVPMQTEMAPALRLCELSDNVGCVKYDAFFERIGLGVFIGIAEEDICVDLYGNKFSYDEKKYLLTLKKKDYKTLKTYGLEYKPHELNVMLEHGGNVIILYDLQHPVKAGQKKINEIYRNYEYYLRINNNIKKLGELFWDLLKIKIVTRISKIKRIIFK